MIANVQKNIYKKSALLMSLVLILTMLFSFPVFAENSPPLMTSAWVASESMIYIDSNEAYANKLSFEIDGQPVDPDIVSNWDAGWGYVFCISDEGLVQSLSYGEHTIRAYGDGLDDETTTFIVNPYNFQRCMSLTLDDNGTEVTAELYVQGAACIDGEDVPFEDMTITFSDATLYDDRITANIMITDSSGSVYTGTVDDGFLQYIIYDGYTFYPQGDYSTPVCGDLVFTKSVYDPGSSTSYNINFNNTNTGIMVQNYSYSTDGCVYLTIASAYTDGVTVYIDDNFVSPEYSRDADGGAIEFCYNFVPYSDDGAWHTLVVRAADNTEESLEFTVTSYNGGGSTPNNFSEDGSYNIPATFDYTPSAVTGSYVISVPAYVTIDSLAPSDDNTYSVCQLPVNVHLNDMKNKQLAFTRNKTDLYSTDGDYVCLVDDERYLNNEENLLNETGWTKYITSVETAFKSEADDPDVRVKQNEACYTGGTTSPTYDGEVSTYSAVDISGSGSFNGYKITSADDSALIYMNMFLSDGSVDSNTEDGATTYWYHKVNVDNIPRGAYSGTMIVSWHIDPEPISDAIVVDSGSGGSSGPHTLTWTSALASTTPSGSSEIGYLGTDEYIVGNTYVGQEGYKRIIVRDKDTGNITSYHNPFDATGSITVEDNEEVVLQMVCGTGGGYILWCDADSGRRVDNHSDDSSHLIESVLVPTGGCDLSVHYDDYYEDGGDTDCRWEVAFSPV